MCCVYSYAPAHIIHSHFRFSRRICFGPRESQSRLSLVLDRSRSFITLIRGLCFSVSLCSSLPNQYPSSVYLNQLMIHPTAERFKRERANERKIESFFGDFFSFFSFFAAFRQLFFARFSMKEKKRKKFCRRNLRWIICFQQTN